MRFLKRFTCFALTSTSIIVAAENGGLPLDLSSTDETNQKAGLPNLIIPSDNSESISLQSSPLSEIVLTPPNNTPNRVPSSDNEEDDKQQEIVENFSNDGSFDEIPLTLDSTTSVTKNEDDNSNLHIITPTSEDHSPQVLVPVEAAILEELVDDTTVAAAPTLALTTEEDDTEEDITSGDTTITENAEVVSAVVILGNDVNSSIGEMTVDQAMKHVYPNFTSAQAEEIKHLFIEAKASEEAFKEANDTAKLEFERLKITGASNSEILAFATAQKQIAHAQVEKFQAIINKFDEKSTNGKNLSSYTPHMGLNASPQIYEDWIVAVEQLSSDSSLQVENLTSGDTTITENAEVVSAIVIPESDVNSSTGTLLIEDENKSNDSDDNEGRAISEQVVDPTTTQLPAVATNTTSSPQKTFWTRATHYLNKKWGIGL